LSLARFSVAIPFAAKANDDLVGNDPRNARLEMQQATQQARIVRLETFVNHKRQRLERAAGHAVPKRVLDASEQFGRVLPVPLRGLKQKFVGQLGRAAAHPQKF